MAKYSHTLAAVEAREKRLKATDGADLWTIGKAIQQDLYSEGRRRPSDHSHDGSRAELVAIAIELEKNGYADYSVETLRKIYDTWETFPSNRRHNSVTFWVHREAKNPDILDWIIEHKPKKQEATAIYVRGMVQRWTEKHKEDLSQRNQQAKFRKKKAADDKKRADQTNDDKARKKAEADEAEADSEIEATRNPPLARDLPPPTGDEGPALIKELDATRLGRQVLKTAEEASKIILAADFDATATAVLEEIWLKAKNAVDAVYTAIAKPEPRTFPLIKGGKS